MKKILFAFIILLLPLAISANQQFYANNFIAAWSKSSYIKLHLINHDDQLSGYYSFSNDPTITYVDKQIWFNGKMDSKGKVELTQSTDGKDVTIFSGRLQRFKQHGRINATLNGKWYVNENAAKTKKAVKFELQDLSPSQQVSLMIKNEYSTNDQYHYTTQLIYPHLWNEETDSNIENFNRRISEQVEKIKDGFIKQAIQNQINLQHVANPPNFGNSLSIDYQVTLAKNGLVSLIMTVDTYFNGAAHPYTYNLSFNYDVTQGKFLQLADLFNKSSNYLSLIANYCQAQLTQQLITDEAPAQNQGFEKEWIETGAKAIKKNYTRWNLTAKGLLITFDPYQVAAYVYGRQQVLIPYSALTNIVKVNGVIDRIGRR